MLEKVRDAYPVQVAMNNSFGVHILDALGYVQHLINLSEFIQLFDKRWNLTALCILAEAGFRLFLQWLNVPFSINGDTRYIICD